MLHCIACANLFFTLKQEPEFLPTAFAVILKPVKGSPNDVRGPIRGVSLPKSLHHGEVKHPGSALVFLVEILSRPSNNLGPLREVFSRKHRVHCLKAVPGYWCKIAKHCKQIPLTCNRQLFNPCTLLHMERKQRHWNVSLDK